MNLVTKYLNDMKYMSTELLELVMKDKFSDQKYRVVISNMGGMTIYFDINNVGKEDFMCKFKEETLKIKNEKFQFLQQYYEYPIEEIKIINSLDIEEEYYYNMLFDSEKIVQEQYLHLSSWIENDRQVNKELPPVITFYSYKGGVGRSTALAANAVLLSRKGKKVVVLDFDLEAPGISSYLINPELQSPKGVIDYLIEKPILKDRMDVDAFKNLFFRKVNSDLSGNGDIFVMSAGKSDFQYIKKMSHIDFEIMEKQNNKMIASLLEDINNVFKPDVILIDSRTGIVDMAGTLLFSYSDFVCSFFYNSEQNKQGLKILVDCISNRIKNNKYIPDFIYIHSPIRYEPGSEGDKGFHDEFVNYLKDLFGDVFLEDELKKIFDDELKIDYVQKLESLERIDFNTFKNEKLFKDFERISQYFNFELDNDKNSKNLFQNKNIREVILNEINFGQYIAEDEKYDDIEYFKNNFLMVNEFEDIISDNCSLVLGAKGSGKSVLYSVLKNQQELVKSYYAGNGDYSKRVFIEGYNCYDGFYTIDQFSALEEKRKIENIDKSVFWKRFWSVYLYLQIYKNKNLLELEDINWISHQELENIMDKDINSIFNYLKDYDLYWNIEKKLDSISEKLKSNHNKIVILYDNLEKTFEAKLLRSKIVEGLLLFWQSKQHSWFNILPKIFLRMDIYKDVVNIQNKSHLDTRKIEIEWNKEELYRLVLKRALSSSKTLLTLMETDLKIQIYNSDIGINISKDEYEIKKMIEIIFGNKIRPNQKSAFTYNWFYNRLRDGNGNLYPRDIITLLNLAVKDCKEEINKDSKGTLIPGTTLEKENVYDKTCEKRFEALCEEYESKVEIFRGMKNSNMQFPMERKELEVVITKIIHNNEYEETLSSIIESLISIGIIESYKNEPDKFRMPDLYLRGFNAIRKGPR